MATASTPPIEQARTIFSDLGYTLTGDGEEFRAERKWRVVRVTATSDVPETPDGGDLRCFVVWEEDAPALGRAVRRADPEYEWAIIGVSESGEYEVTRAPPGVDAAA